MVTTLSVIVPVYYNEQNLPALYEALHRELAQQDFAWELILVDDGSKDGSYTQMCALQKKDPRVRLVRLSRNFGSHIAILAGFAHAQGDCMTMIAADLQDPPEIIPKMLEKWRKGAKVVMAVRKDREDSFSSRIFSNFYYRLMRRYALPNMPLGGFDCFLIDRQVRDVLVRMQEKNSSIVGQVLWTGFPCDQIEYVRKKRTVGRSRWTLSKKIKLFIDSFMAFSYLPVRFISMLGISLSVLGFGLAVFLVFNRIAFDVPVQGWTTLMITVLLLSGIQLLTLGVIGEYLWRSFDESRSRPLYIVEETRGFEEFSGGSQ